MAKNPIANGIANVFGDTQEQLRKEMEKTSEANQKKRNELLKKYVSAAARVVKGGIRNALEKNLKALDPAALIKGISDSQSKNAIGMDSGTALQVVSSSFLALRVEEKALERIREDFTKFQAPELKH